MRRGLTSDYMRRNFQHIYFEGYWKLFYTAMEKLDYKTILVNISGSEDGITEILRRHWILRQKSSIHNPSNQLFKKIPGSPISLLGTVNQLVDMIEKATFISDYAFQSQYDQLRTISRFPRFWHWKYLTWNVCLNAIDQVEADESNKKCVSLK